MRREKLSSIQSEIGYARQMQKTTSVPVEPFGSQSGNCGAGIPWTMENTLGPCPSKPSRDSVSTRLAKVTLVLQMWSDSAQVSALGNSRHVLAVWLSRCGEIVKIVEFCGL